MLSKFNVNPDDLQRHLKVFKSEFVRSFERKLDEAHNTAIGRSAVEVKYSRKGSLAQYSCTITRSVDPITSITSLCTINSSIIDKYDI